MNEELNKYKSSDFSHYYASNLNYTEKMKENVMKTFNLKVMYEVQLGLMTNAYYDRYYKTEMAVIAKNPNAMFYRFERNVAGYIN